MHIHTELLSALSPALPGKCYDTAVLRRAQATINHLLQNCEILTAKQLVFLAELMRYTPGNIFADLHHQFQGFIKVWDTYLTALGTCAVAVEKYAELIDNAQLLISQLKEHYSFRILAADFDQEQQDRDALLTHVDEMITFTATELDAHITRHITHTRGLLTSLCVQGKNTIHKISATQTPISENFCVIRSADAFDLAQAQESVLKLHTVIDQTDQWCLNESLGDFSELWSLVTKSISDLIAHQRTVLADYQFLFTEMVIA